MNKDIKITHTEDFFNFSKKYYKNARSSLIDLDFINTYLDNPGGNRRFFVAHDDKNIMGVLSYSNQNTRHKTLLTALSVHPTYKNKRISEKLIDGLLKWSIKNKKFIINTEYTEEGALFLQKTINKKLKEYPSAIFIEDKFIKSTRINNNFFNTSASFKQTKKVYDEYYKEIKKIEINPDYSVMNYEKAISISKIIHAQVDELNQKIINTFIEKYKSKKQQKNKLY